MQRKAIVGLFSLLLLLMVLLMMIQQHTMNHSQEIAHAVESLLSDNTIEPILASQEDKLMVFRDKFIKGNFSDYRVEAFQPSDENTVYLMLIVEPLMEDEHGIVLYMTFELDEKDDSKVNNLIISNWVVIEFSGTQF